MRMVIASLIWLALSSGAWAQCQGPAGVPFNCNPGNTPSGNDYVLGGSNTPPQNGKTVRWTWNQVFASYYASLYNALSVGNTLVNNGTSGYLLTNNSGVLGNIAQSSLSLSGSQLGAGTVANSKLANASTTVNGQTCTLGSTCTVSASGSLVVGSSAITSGTSGRVLYDNAGVLGEIATTGSNSVVLATSPTLVTPALGTPSALVLTNATGLPCGATPALTGAVTTSAGSCATSASSALLQTGVASQTIAGGANVTSLSLSTGSITVDCGARPLQYVTNGGSFTLTAPSSDGSCAVLTTNNGSAGAITFSGFSVGSNTGDALTTTSGDKFTVFVWRINGTAGYRVAAHQ